jgi:hypothetical protein
VTHDPDFDRFCEDLENLKGTAPLYKSRAGLTDKIMFAVRHDHKARQAPSFRDLFRPLAIVSLILGGAWFFFRDPSAPNRPSLQLTSLQTTVR